MTTMYKKFVTPLLGGITMLLVLTNCKKWDDRLAITDNDLKENLLEKIQANTDLTLFAELLEKSGYADTLASSKTYTVFAPKNDALTSLMSSIETDSLTLRKFVSNHIANQTYYVTRLEKELRIPVLNGKYHHISSSKVDDVSFETKDNLAKNGVIQLITTALPVLENTWDFIVSNNEMPNLQKIYMKDSLLQKVFSSSTAIQTGVDGNGNPIYQAGTDSISSNRFWTRVSDLRNEAKEYTLFVLKDNAWQTEINRLAPYYITGTSDSTKNLSSWAVVKDLAVDTLYADPTTIPDTIMSKFGVKVGVNKANIVKTIKTSNGIVYVMSAHPVTPQNKFQTIVIEAENYSGTSANRSSNTYLRDRVDSASGNIFRDILVYNHGLPMFNLRYRLTEIPSIKYRVYWQALNDNINGMTTTFTQKIGVDSFNSPLPTYVTVPLNRYAEQYAGEFTLTKYRSVFNLYLVAANTTTANTNAIVCNYIKLVPVF